MPAAPLPQSAVLHVDGTRLSQEIFDKLTEIRVESTVGAAGHFLLRFLSDEGMPGAFKIGSEVKISFDDEKLSPVEVITGTVEGLAIDYDLDRRQLTVTGYDARRALSTASIAKTYTEQTYKDILAKIASASGLNAKIDPSLGTVVFEHVLQTESDLAFVHRIATASGMEWLVDGKDLIVRPRTAATKVKVEFGDRLRRLSARYTTAEQPEEVSVTGWDTKDKKVIVQKAAPAAPVGAVPVETRYRKKAAEKRKSAVRSSVVSSVKEATDAAKAIGSRMASASLVGRGETVGDPRIKPGVSLEISGVDADWNGTYYVTGAEHVSRDGEPYLTRFTVGAQDSSSLVDLLGTPGAPAAQGTRSAHTVGHGVTIGIVTNVKNAKRDQAEVKVKFPYLGDIESGWIRVAMPWAGQGRGMLFMPEVNDEVLVAFENGDLARGYMIGAVWNGKDTPPVSWKDSKNHHLRVLKSVKGHTITIADGGGNEQFVSIVLGDDTTTLLLSKEKIELIANSGKPIEVKNDKAKVVLTGSGDLQLEAQNITIKATQKVNIEGAEISTKSKNGTKVEAGTMLDLKATAKGVFDGGAMAEIKGASMVKIN